MPQQTLKETAEAEANLAEAELKNRSKGKKKTKSNGKAKANGEAAVSSKPGEQGAATQEATTNETPPPIWQRPDVTKKDSKNAEPVFHKLQSDAQDMGAEKVIDAKILAYISSTSPSVG